ncbi:hypothetical protein B0H10DRAFT_1965643 [Mycena sp. CBHHK59/15]|nr:hypothetical protein B0H10DRAFT_1965643 [Mycena sp. CBHHK59/15]
MSKRKTSRRKSPDPSKGYRPRRTKEEQAANHRKAQAAHYARNPEIREKRRVQVAEKRAAEKLKKRQWDPPKLLQTVEDSDSDNADENTADIAETPRDKSVHPTMDVDTVSDNYNTNHDLSPANLRALSAESSISTTNLNADVLDPTSEAEAVRGTRASPTSDEWVASQALTTLAALAEPARCMSQDLVLERAMLLSSDNGIPQALPRTPEAVAALAANAGTALLSRSDTVGSGPDPLARVPRVIAAVGPLSRVEAAQACIAALNSGKLSRPTSDDAARWEVAHHHLEAAKTSGGEGLPIPTELEDSPVLTDAQLQVLGDAMTKQKKQIENWFRHRRSRMADVGAIQRRSQTSLSHALFQLKPTRFRRHQPIEIFQKRNKEPIREVLTEAGFDGLNEEQVSKTMGIYDWVSESLESHQERVRESKSQRMRLRTRVIRAMWAEAPTAEREACEAIAEKEKTQPLNEQSVPEDEPTPAEYQLAIDETGEVFHRVHELVSHKAGWKGFTIVGGPNPRLGGALSMKIICEGVSPAGNDFQAAHASFEESVGIPFQQWLKRVFLFLPESAENSNHKKKKSNWACHFSSYPYRCLANPSALSPHFFQALKIFRPIASNFSIAARLSDALTPQCRCPARRRRRTRVAALPRAQCIAQPSARAPRLDRERRHAAATARHRPSQFPICFTAPRTAASTPGRLNILKYCIFLVPLVGLSNFSGLQRSCFLSAFWACTSLYKCLQAPAMSTPDDAGVDIDKDVVLDEDVAFDENDPIPLPQTSPVVVEQQESQPAPKLKKPKRMNKPKGKKAAEATPAAVTPAASTPTDSSDSATIPVPTPAVMPALDSPHDIFDTNTSDSDETLFSSGNTSFHHMDVDPSPLASARNTCWPEGMPPLTSPGTAAMAAMIERGGLPGGATYAIDPFLLTTPSPTASAPQRPCPQPAFKGAASATPTQTRTHHVGGFNFPVLTESSPSCSSSSSPSRMPFLFDAFRKNTAAPLAPAVVPSPYTPSSALFQNTGATPFVWPGTSTASMHAAPLVGFTNQGGVGGGNGRAGILGCGNGTCGVARASARALRDGDSGAQAGRAARAGSGGGRVHERRGRQQGGVRVGNGRAEMLGCGDGRGRAGCDGKARAGSGEARAGSGAGRRKGRGGGKAARVRGGRKWWGAVTAGHR